MRRIYSGPPVTVTVEASMDVILKHDLNMLDGEHYDYIGSVIAIDEDNGKVTITSCRSIEAFRKGEPNAGRGVWTFERNMLERIFIGGKVVLGQAVKVC